MPLREPPRTQEPHHHWSYLTAADCGLLDVDVDVSSGFCLGIGTPGYLTLGKWVTGQGMKEGSCNHLSSFFISISFFLLSFHILYSHSFLLSMSPQSWFVLNRKFLRNSSFLFWCGRCSMGIWFLVFSVLLHFIIKWSKSSFSSWHSWHSLGLPSWCFLSSKGSEFVLAWYRITDAGVL